MYIQTMFFSHVSVVILKLAGWPCYFKNHYMGLGANLTPSAKKNDFVYKCVREPGAHRKVNNHTCKLFNPTLIISLINKKHSHMWMPKVIINGSGSYECAWKGLPKAPAALPSALNISSLSNVLQRKRSSCSYSHRVHLQEDAAFFRCKANP